MTFNAFVELKHLRIALILPLGIKERYQCHAFKSLKILHIMHCIVSCNDIIIGHLEEVLSLTSTRMSHLKQVVIEAQWNGKPDKCNVIRLLDLC